MTVIFIKFVFISILSASANWNTKTSEESDCQQQISYQEMSKKLKLNTFRSSHWRCSVRESVYRNIAKFTGKHLCQSLFFNKVAALRHRHGYFPVNFAKFLRTLFLENASGRLLLHIKYMTPHLRMKFGLSSLFTIC